jgi:hypothetical protein
MIKKRILIGILILAAGLLVACNAGEGDPVETVESYLEAKVQGDVEAITGRICAEMESLIERESRTFSSVSDVTLEDMSCTFDGDSRVTCDGRIVALYGTEEVDFPLTSYRVIQEDGEWKWCGEAGP